MSLRVEVDEERCFGSGDCALAAPQAFRVTDEGIAEVLPGADDLSEAELRLIEAQCPSQAIKVTGERAETSS